MNFDLRQGFITLSGFIMLLIAVYREAHILKSVSRNSDISNTAVGAILNAPRIALIANFGRLASQISNLFKKVLGIDPFIPFDAGRSEELYHRYFAPILGIVILGLVNAAYIWKLARDTALYLSSLLDKVDSNTVFLGYGVLLQYAGLCIITLTISELIDYDVKKNKPESILFEGKRVLFFDEELPRSLPVWEKAMSNDEPTIVIDGITVPLERFKNPPEKIYSEEDRLVLQKVMHDPKSAKAYLVENGFVNENGELAKRYISE